MLKRGCDVIFNEVAKCFKFVVKGYCELVSFIVLRKVYNSFLRYVILDFKFFCFRIC